MHDQNSSNISGKVANGSYLRFDYDKKVNQRHVHDQNSSNISNFKVVVNIMIYMSVT